MNFDIIIQLTIVALIVFAGPLVIGLLALKKGNL